VSQPNSQFWFQGSSRLCTRFWICLAQKRDYVEPGCRIRWSFEVFQIAPHCQREWPKVDASSPQILRFVKKLGKISDQAFLKVTITNHVSIRDLPLIWREELEEIKGLVPRIDKLLPNAKLSFQFPIKLSEWFTHILYIGRLAVSPVPSIWSRVSLKTCVVTL